MIIGILTIGDELINGMVVETNSVYISRMLGAEGWQTAAKLSVGDDEQAIRKGLSYALDVSDALIVTGGLGPTVDDITTSSWHLFRLVCDGDADTCVLYQGTNEGDLSSKGSRDVSTKLDLTSFRVKIGGSGGAGKSVSNQSGQIDQVKIWEDSQTP